jgi:hypothetical protein
MTLENGRQIYLGETDIELLKTLLRPGADFADDGCPENDQAILYQKLSDQLRVDPSALWVSLYEETQQYGGPEEGGWWYTHYELSNGRGFTDTEKLLDYYNDALVDLMDVYTYDPVTICLLTTPALASSVAAAQQSDYDCDPMHTTRFTVDRGVKLMLCIEVQLGSQATVGRPCFS